MFRGLLRLIWVEIKIFFREPLGAVGTIVAPVLVFIFFGRIAHVMPPGRVSSSGIFRVDVPVFAAVLIAINAVLSLVAIIAIYREGGILKRLRATPLRPATILTAHVVVKLILTAAALALTLLAGKRYYPLGANAPLLQFSIALLISTWSILSIGFLIASIVPTARFAQPIGAFIMYPMLALSGLFIPFAAMSQNLRVATRFVPLSYSVSLLRGIWKGDSWSMHSGDLIALVVIFVLCTALSTKVFRWE